MIYMLEIYKNYKTEVREFLANDPTLLQEIEYDLRQQNGVRKSRAHSPSQQEDDDDEEDE